MNAVKVLVVDDEMIIAENSYDNPTSLGYEVLEPAISYTEAMRSIEEENPDIAILDIQLSGSKTGIDLAREIRRAYDIPFIFLTTHANEVTVNEAKQTWPPTYLIKPFTKGELYSSIENALHNYTFKMGGMGAENQGHLIIKNALFLKEKGAFSKIDFKDIVYLRSSHVYVDVVLTDGKKIVVRGSLNHIIAKLDTDFVRIHRGYIVNLKHLQRTDNTTVSTGEEQLPIGKKYREDLLKKIIIA